MTATLVDQSPAIAGAELRTIAIADLRESPDNPRKHFDAAALEQLTDSVRMHGVLTPLLVRELPDGALVIAGGHRRYRAAKIAGLDAVPALVSVMSDEHFLEVLTIDNLQRDDLHPLEEAAGFRMLMERAGYDPAKLAARVGRSVQYVYDRLKLLQLLPDLQELFLDGKFTAGHAVLLARLSPTDQRRVAGTKAEGWTDGRLFEELYDDDLFGDDSEDEAQPTVVATSIRELAEFIARDIRIDASAEALALEFPDAAAVVATARRVVEISRNTWWNPEDRKRFAGVLGREEWIQSADPAACPHTATGLIVVGPGLGTTLPVCTERNCPIHWAKSSSRMADDDAQPDDRWKRQQEEFARKQKRAQEKKRLAAERRRRVFAAVYPALPEAFDEGALRGVIAGYLNEMTHDGLREVCLAFSWEPARKKQSWGGESIDYQSPILTAVDAMPIGERIRFLQALQLVPTPSEYGAKVPDPLFAVAPRVGVDVAAIDAEIAAAAKAKAAKSKKKASKQRAGDVRRKKGKA